MIRKRRWRRRTGRSDEMVIGGMRTVRTRARWVGGEANGQGEEAG